MKVKSTQVRKIMAWKQIETRLKQYKQFLLLKYEVIFHMIGILSAISERKAKRNRAIARRTFLGIAAEISLPEDRFICNGTFLAFTNACSTSHNSTSRTKYEKIFLSHFMNLTVWSEQLHKN